MSLGGREPDLSERLLFREAASVAERAYAPYSGFSVGAVAVGPSGRSHHGVNVENAAYPAGLCAERAALAAMVVFGERRARYVAVAAADGSDVLPCGMCLQAMAEFGTPEVVARSGGEVRVFALADLLPAPFARSRAEGGEPGKGRDGDVHCEGDRAHGLGGSAHGEGDAAHDEGDAAHDEGDAAHDENDAAHDDGHTDG